MLILVPLIRFRTRLSDDTFQHHIEGSRPTLPSHLQLPTPPLYHQKLLWLRRSLGAGPTPMTIGSVPGDPQRVVRDPLLYWPRYYFSDPSSMRDLSSMRSMIATETSVCFSTSSILRTSKYRNSHICATYADTHLRDLAMTALGCLSGKQAIRQADMATLAWVTGPLH